MAAMIGVFVSFTFPESFDASKLRGIAQHAQGHAEDPVLMRGDQCLEGPRVTRPEPLEELRGIGSISFPHS